MKKQSVWINGRFLAQPLTGVQRYAWELVQSLDVLLQKGAVDADAFDIRLIVPPSEIHDIPLKKIPIEKVGRLKGQAWEQIELPFYAWGKNLVGLCNSAPILPRGRGATLTLTIHDLSFKYYPESYSFPYRMLHGFLSPRLFALADRIVTVSYAEKARLLKYHPEVESRMRVVHHGGDHALRYPVEDEAGLPEKIRLLSRRDYILFIGSFNPLKNLRTLIRAFEKIAPSNEVDLVVVGGGGNVFPKMDLPASDSLARRIHFLGQINSPRQIRYLYEKARMLVAPSLSESFGLPCLEAMTLGCPVIASDIPAFNEVCGDAFLHVSPMDVEGVSARIGELLSNTALREGLRTKGIERAKNFTWENTARETWAIILESICR